MIRSVLFAAAAALALAACNQSAGSGPPLPPPQAGVQAPSTPRPPASPPQRAQVTDEVRQQLLGNIADLLNQASAQFAPGMSSPEGFSDEVAPMQPSTDHRWRFDLRGGQEYRVIGVCDGDCSDIDIELIDSRGGVVASDLLEDDYPVVTFTPPADGAYYARAIMQVCTVAPCFAGMRVLTSGPAQANGKPT